MYLFARVVTTKYYELSDLKIYFLTILEVRSSRPKCLQGLFLLRTVRDSLFHASPLASGGLLAVFGTSWLIRASFQSLL